jgi:predicted GNAT superfamily acetyltransferase
MNQTIVQIIDTRHPDWAGQVDALRVALGAPNNPLLFPAYYLKATFPKIGGKLAVIRSDGVLLGVGFLFPRGTSDGVREYTVRYHTPSGSAAPLSPHDKESLLKMIEQAVPSCRTYFYGPTEKHSFAPRGIETVSLKNNRTLQIRSPTEQESESIRDMHRIAWQGPPEDDLYPADVHSMEFKPATSLLGTIENKPVGFLFGFYKFSDSKLPKAWQERLRYDLRIESQLTGVIHEYRRYGIAAQLKRVQTQQAAREGIDIINWTVDPLQYANAVLNFNKLKGVCFTFYPNYYTFRNPLNTVSASRFEITLLTKAQRVREGLTNLSGSLSGLPESAHVVNDGVAHSSLNSEAEQVAIEIPAHWTELQGADHALATRWREVTDALFGHYVGYEQGQYIITAARERDNRKYLLAQRVDDNLLTKLSD